MTMGVAELRINLGSLKRQDPYIDKIVDSSTHVAIYSFSPERNEWEKTDVEGTLFVYKRVAPPYWGFTIMNRLSMDNLTEPLASELEFQTQNPFLLYRNAKLLIYGIWFYDQEDCRRIGQLLQRLCNKEERPPQTQTTLPPSDFFAAGDAELLLKGTTVKSQSPASNSANSVSPGSSVGGPLQQASNEEADSEYDEKEIAQSKGPGPVDILDLLSKAQDKFEKKRTTPDPVNDNSRIPGNSESLQHIIKPVPLKAANPQKLDVATLFKRHAPGIPTSAPVNQNQPLNPTGGLHATSLNHRYRGTAQQPTTQTSVFPPKTLIPQLARSQSATELAMRNHIDSRMNGSVLSVEQIEAGLGRDASVNRADERQQQVNTTLDVMIDRINSGRALNTSDCPARALPVLSEVSAPVFSHSLPGSAGAGPGQRSGTSFTKITPHPYINQTRSRVQRSVSSSSLPHGNGFPPMASGFPPYQAGVDQRQAGVGVKNALLNGVVMEKKNSGAARPSPISIPVANMFSKSPSVYDGDNAANAPASPATLISPEDFELSAATREKSMELKRRLSAAAKPGAVNSSASPAFDALTKDQLRDALVHLLQTDDSFLSTIHGVYSTQFEQH